MMEFKRVFNLKSILVLVCICMASAILFYGEQNASSSDYLKSYSNDEIGGSTKESVNNMIDRMLTEYYAENKLDESDVESFEQFRKEFYSKNIEKDTPEFSDYKLAVEIIHSRIDYISGYQETIRKMRENAVEMSKFSNFSDKNSYAYRNLAKTYIDLKRYVNIETREGGETAFESIYQFPYTLPLVLVFVLYCVYKILNEDGMEKILFATSRGRIILQTKRVLILLFCSLIASVLINGVVVAESYYLYGGFKYLGNSVQSSQNFQLCQLLLSRRGYLAVQVFVIALCAAVIGYLAMGIIRIFKNQLLISLIAGSILVTEYLLFLFIRTNSGIGVLKYFNICILINPMQSLVEYENVGFIQSIVGRIDLFLWFLMFSTCAGIALLLVSASRWGNVAFAHAENNTLVSWISRFSNKLVSALPVALAEVYKTFVTKKGLLILAVVCYLISDVQVIRNTSYSGSQMVVNSFLLDCNGQSVNVVTKDKFNQFRNDVENTKQKVEELNTKKAEGETFNYSEWLSLKNELQEKQDATVYLEHYFGYVEDKSDSEGVSVQLIPQFEYEHMMGEYTNLSFRWLLMYLVLFVILITSISFSMEKQGNVHTVIKTASYGRKRFVIRKISVNAHISVLSGILILLHYYVRLIKLYNLRFLDSSIWSIENLQDFPVNISIREYLILGFAMKIVVILAITNLVTLISVLTNQKISMLISILMLIPHFLYLCGIEGFSRLSIVYLLNDWQVIQTFGSMYLIGFWLLMCVAGTISTVLAIRKWESV